jgi:hypothetical protein
VSIVQSHRLPAVYKEELLARLEEEWLPPYLADYGYAPGGYVPPRGEISKDDARWFLAGMDQGVVELLPKARLKLPASPVKAMIFWSGSTKVSPRPVTVHLEGILSAGMAARLHLEHGWSVDQLGFEYPPRKPGRRAFDLAALAPDGSVRLVGEAKKSVKELDHVLTVIAECSVLGHHVHGSDERGVTNGHRKWEGLNACRPDVFFTFGPNDDLSVFDVTHGKDGTLRLQPGSRDLLTYRG